MQVAVSPACKVCMVESFLCIMQTRLSVCLSVLQALANKKAEWQPGVYVRAFGHVTRGANGPNMNAYGVRSIQNFNEVTYDYLYCAGGVGVTLLVVAIG